MRIHLGSDSTGYTLATLLRRQLAERGHEVVWHAAPELDEGDDYPAIAIRTARAVVADEDAGVDARAVIVGDTGAGEVVAANKVNGARVVSATDLAYLAAARARADVNGVVIPARFVSHSQAAALVEVVMDSSFSSDLDDARRLVNIAEFESSGTIEGWTIER